MQRFEYLVAETLSGGIIAVNGNPVGSTTKWKASPIDKMVGIKDRDVFSPEHSRKIWDYLNERGGEGWELAGVAGGPSGGVYLYTLKRPLG